ncbi:Ig-like domain-containing protein [Bacilliculturomica massiliensis]|uniref:Ig-like domain-containing protein n=1 Tax=Bacilliculturomica massiliensis TaxID=1917867 RepID=UPI001031658F|nr:Ig-like domain-containing protein [Bacilliculturomica massiliensis]
MLNNKLARRRGRWLACLLIACMVITSSGVISMAAGEGCGDAAEGAFTVGDGTAESPYEITNAAQFDHIREHLTSSFVLKNDIDLSSISNFEPIGIAGGTLSNFTGTLDGGGFKVSGFRQTVTAANRDGKYVVAGLFGYVAQGGSVSNMQLDDFRVSVEMAGVNIGGVVWIGSLCGAVGGTLKNVRVTDGNVDVVTGTTSTIDVGAVVGSLTKTAQFQSIYSNTAVTYNTGKAANITVLGNNAGSGIGAINDCLFVGTLTKAGGLDAEKIGFCGTTTNYAGDSYVLDTYATEVSFTGRATKKTAAELTAGDLFTLDAAYWTAEVGSYPYLTTFGKPDPATIIVTGITVTAPAAVIDTKGGTLQMSAEVVPENAANKNVTWSVDDESKAAISEAGLLTASADGSVVVTAAAQDRSGVSGTFTVTITNQSGTASVCGHDGEGAFTVGAGTSASPYEITNAAQFNHIREHLTSSFVLKNDIDLSSLGNFIPIGIAGGTLSNFTGNLDGGGFKVSGLRQRIGAINRDGRAVVAGLFGYVAQGGSVSNMQLDDFSVSVEMPSANAEGTAWLGSLCGAVGGTLKNVAITDGTVDIVLGKATITDIGAVAGSLAGSARFQSVYSDTAVTYNTGKAANVTVLGNNGGNGIGAINDCLFVGTLTKAGGVDAEKIGFCGTNTNYAGDSYVLDTYATEVSYTGRATKKSDAELTAGDLFTLDPAYWTAEAGSYPYLTAFGKPASAMKDSVVTAAPSGAPGIFGMMSPATGYGTVNTIIKTKRPVSSGSTLQYSDGTNNCELYYSRVLDAFLGYVPAGVTVEDVTAGVSEKTGTVKTIRYGIIGDGRDNRDAVGFKDLYYFDKTVLLGQTVPNGQFERMMAMDVDANFELDLADLMSIIQNYVFGTEFSKAE